MVTIENIGYLPKLLKIQNRMKKYKNTSVVLMLY